MAYDFVAIYSTKYVSMSLIGTEAILSSLPSVAASCSDTEILVGGGCINDAENTDLRLIVSSPFTEDNFYQCTWK